MNTPSRKLLLAILCCLPIAVEAKMPSALGTDGLEPVSSFFILGRSVNYQPLANNSLMIWTAPSKPYLVMLQQRSPELRFAWSIGLTSLNGRVSSGFDNVVIDGFRYPIRSIYALDRAKAEELVSKAHRTS